MTFLLGVGFFLAGAVVLLVGLSWTFFWYSDMTYPRPGSVPLLSGVMALLGAIPMIVGVWLMVRPFIL